MPTSIAEPVARRHRVISEMRPEMAKADRVKAENLINPAHLRAFLTEIEKPSGDVGCWFWRGSLNSTGYASGRAAGLPHRIAYEWMVAPIPSSMELDHLCRNRACVNPHHLEPVTRAENIRRSKQPVGPFEIRRYCRRGHALDVTNGRMWSNGKGQREMRCYACHDGERSGTRHV